MRFVNDYLKETFGCKVYKLSLQAKVTCPNRDGSLGTSGCIFCSAGGSGEFAADADKPIPQQMIEAKARIAAKVKGDAKYIAYFQSFTNTYGELSYLEQIYREAMAPEDVVILSIATRPDSISEEMYELLGKLNRIKPVWIELGLQTIHEKSAAYIRRGYTLPVYDACIKRLKALGITVIVHLILGLPGEDKAMMQQSVKYVVDSGADGIKLQLLHVLKGTDLEQDYLAGNVPVMSLEAYVELLQTLLPLIPDSVVIHRLTGDGPKKLLVAPLWSGDKKRVLNAIHQMIQGEKHELYTGTDRSLQI